MLDEPGGGLTVPIQQARVVRPDCQTVQGNGVLIGAASCQEPRLPDDGKYLNIGKRSSAATLLREFSAGLLRARHRCG